MQGQAQSPIPQWLVFALANLATLITLGTAWYKERQNRRRLEADVELQKAQAHLSDAQVRFTEVQTEGAQIANRKTLAEMLDGCYIRIDSLEATADQLVRERNTLKLEADKVPHLEDQIKLFEKQMGELECIISASGINKGDVLDKIKGIKE